MVGYDLWDTGPKLNELLANTHLILTNQNLILVQLHETREQMTSAQGDIDADVAALTASEAGIASAVTALVAEIANLQSQGVDTTKLDAIAAQFTADTTADQADVPPAS
jgi:cell division protein FtsB